MNSLKHLIVLIILSSVSVLGQQVFAADMGIPLQLKLKNPAGQYPTESGLTFRVLVLSPTSSCILRDEIFSSQNIVNGAVNLNLGSGSLGPQDPALTLNQVYSNAVAKTGLSCVDANNNITLTGQTYTPNPSDSRVVRVLTVIGSDTILVNFNMKSVPYAVQAESVAGKAGADILVRNTGTQLNQANLENLMQDASRVSNLMNVAQNSSTTNATNFTGSLTGDVTGTQSATVVSRIQGVPVSNTSPSSGQVLQYNGTQYVPTSIALSAVTSVAGRTGAVVLSSSDISGLGSAAGLNAGTASGDLAQLDGGGKIPLALLPNTVVTTSTTLSGDVTGSLSSTTVSLVGGKTAAEVSGAVDDVMAAVATNTADTLVKRDSSGHIAVNNLSSTSVTSNNLYLYNAGTPVRVKASGSTAASFDLTLPSNAGLNGQVLQTDGSGNLSWVTPSAASGSVTAVTASGPLSSSGGSNPNISISQASASSAGFLSSTDWSVFNSKQNALGYTPLSPANNLSDLSSAATARTNLGLGSVATLSVGTTSGTVAAGDDSRITGALQSSAYATDVAGASSCTTSQTPYWNTVSDSWACQNINFPASAVTSVAGKTGAVTLTSSDISGLGTAASYNVGTSPGQVVILDGSAKIPSAALPGSALTSSSVLSGDVTGTVSATSVVAVGGKTSSQIASTVNAVDAATDANSAGALVRRSASGDISVANLNADQVVSADVLATDIAASTINVNDTTTQNLFLNNGSNTINLKAPAGLGSNIVLTLPTGTGANGQILQTDGSGNLSWVNPASVSGTVSNVTASAPLSSSGGPTPNISLTQASSSAAGYLSSTDWTIFNNKQNALGFTPLNPANNLSDVSSAAAARSNLGLGAAAVLNIGTAAGTVAAGDDSRITGALQSSAYATDVAGAATCTSTQTPYWNTVTDSWACQNISFGTIAVTSVAGRTGDIVLTSSDISGLGTAATYNAGVSAGQLVQLDASARLPASTLPTNVLTTSSTFTGDVSGTSAALSVEKIRGVAVSTTAPVAGQALVYNGTEWVPTTGFPTFARSTADQVFTNTTVGNVTGLSFAVVSGQVYKFKFHVAYTATNTNTGLALGLTYPAATMASAVASFSAGLDGTAYAYKGLINSSGDLVISTASSATGVQMAYVEGIIVPSANGTVQLIGASESNVNVTVKANSLVEVTVVP